MSENIKQLSEKDKVRKRISVWLGSSNHMAVMHCIKELIGNSADEIGKGNGDKIELILHDDKTITIRDNCKGLPVEGINENGTENYQLLFEHLFAGTKYENGIDNKHYTVGTNGLFLCILTYASEEVEYTIARPNGNVYKVGYKKGILDSPFEVIGKTDETYTDIRFKLDDEVFEENYYKFTEICEIANEQASLLVNGVISVEDVPNNQKILYQYNSGITEFLENETVSLRDVSKISSISRNVSHSLEKENTVDDMKVEIVFKYTREDEDKTMIEFLNGSNLIHHGTIYEGLISGFRNSVNKFIRDNKMYKKNEKQITREDILVGLNYVVDFKSYFPVYSNQTKFASEVGYYKTVMQDVVQDHFDSYSLENKKDMEDIANQVLGEKRARESAENTRLNLKSKLQKPTNTFDKVEKLITCRSNDKNIKEIFIAEGDSAKDSLLQGRDKLFQSIYPIRGKILSCYKATPQQIFSNDTITNIYKILECGIEMKDKNNKSFTNFSLDNLQYNKIIIAADSDDDADQIVALLLSMFYILTPTLIKEGYVYRAESPLFEIMDMKTEELYYAYNDIERDKIIKDNNLKNYEVSRNKG